ncbi:MAG: hypothetical protein M8364_04000 [Methylobacter sp.]|uniref:hypothetical protein n=1 Tax=Methylobacter sp. TaxID=2051955 RepID=UPI00259025DC|nr:hypothetical protein [Methylobacter sp.]MCL7420049.1 hypothetical protein [Methylobacter sp.]
MFSGRNYPNVDLPIFVANRGSLPFLGFIRINTVNVIIKMIRRDTTLTDTVKTELVFYSLSCRLSSRVWAVLTLAVRFLPNPAFQKPPVQDLALNNGLAAGK